MQNFAEQGKATASAGEDTAVPGMKRLKEQIPAHCFEPSLFKSSQYVVRDLFLMAVLFYVGLRYIPNIENYTIRIICWMIYGFTQGLVMTGVWILAHECGHNSFSKYPKVNSTIGFFLHTVILVPYFSWKFTHARHHRYTNHMDKDTVFSPAHKSDFRSSFWTGNFLGEAEDAPLVSAFLLLGHQLIGWPLYILANAGAGMDSLMKSDRTKSNRQSHLDPNAHLFTPQEHPYIILSDVGLAIMISALWYASKILGFYNVCLLYGVPYLWMNHWLVAITYLHHTHPDVPHYDADTWNYQSGALGTIDRDFGFIGRHIFHGIIEYHVIHHMFPRIPFYHAEEATKAIAPLLGKAYKEERNSFLGDLWSTFTKCRFVEESNIHQGHFLWSQ